MARPPKNYIVWRNGSATVRYQVPANVRATIGKRELLHTLGKVSKCEAARLSIPIIADFINRIDQAANREFRGWVIPNFADRSSRLENVYSDDARIPTWDANRLQGLRAELAQLETKSADAVSYTSILDRWYLERGTDGSLQKFTGFMKQLFEFAATGDANRITTQHILDYETSLRQERRLHANTISNMLAAYKALFRFARRKGMITIDPAEDIEVPPKVETGKKYFPPAMAQRIVREAQKLRPELYLAVLIQSVTGCRVSEIVNRQTTDIREEEGAVIFEIPSTGAGRGKTKSSARIIPVHPGVAPMLLAHRNATIAVHGEGYLFPELPRGKAGNAKPSVYGTRVIDEWFREKLEIKDKMYSPNHSWRHTVKTALLKAKVDPTIRNMLTGHGKNVAQKYEHGDIAMMAEAITSTLPNPFS